MIMRSDSEKFGQVRRLLKLKRHEQPPPGYFQNFPDQVISRIRAGEHAADPNVLQLLFMELPWLQRLWTGLETKPVLTGLIGAAACVLLFIGLMLPGRQELRPDQFSSATAGIMFPTPAERGRVSPSLARGTSSDFFETNLLGGFSGGSLIGQPVKFTPEGN
jgi:hypothetical protein